MLAYLMAIIGVLSRVVPHPYSLTAVGGSLLYFGARRPMRQFWFPVVLLAASDYYLTSFVYSYPFHLSGYVITWAWYLGACLLGAAMLRKQNGPARVVFASFASSTSFFLLTNFVWSGSPLYPRGAAGLMMSYTAGLPFYARDFAATTLVAGAAFALPALVKMAGEWHHKSNTGATAA